LNAPSTLMETNGSFSCNNYSVLFKIRRDFPDLTIKTTIFNYIL